MTNGTPGEGRAAALASCTLGSVLRGRSNAAEPGEALRELLRRGEASTPLLTELVRDPARPPAVRANAALALGAVPNATARRSLVQALADREAVVVRRAAEALGKIGDQSSLAALEQAAPREPAAARSVEFAKTLIAYRHGLVSHPVRRPPRAAVLRVDPGNALTVRPARPASPEAKSLLAETAQRFPAIALSEQTVSTFDCGENRFVLALSQDARRPAAGASAVAALLLEKSPVSDEHFLAEYVLADPAARGQVNLHGLRPNGTLIHVGELDLSTGSFEIRAIDIRAFPPVEVRGTFDAATGDVTFSQMLIQREFSAAQSAPRSPTLVDD
jgi:hypothetical protein